MYETTPSNFALPILSKPFLASLSVTAPMFWSRASFVFIFNVILTFKRPIQCAISKLMGHASHR